MKTKTVEFRVSVEHPRRWRASKVAAELMDVVNVVTEDTPIKITGIGTLTSLDEVVNGKGRET